jgi:hypothetical protein
MRKLALLFGAAVVALVAMAFAGSAFGGDQNHAQRDQHHAQADQGQSGDHGQKSDQGDQGDQGDRGHRGDQGDQGHQGHQGDQGDHGDHGHGGDQGQAQTCTGGDIAPGTYTGLIVTGNCTIKSGPVTINGNLTVTHGVYLNAGWLGTRLTINGNVEVGKGATLGLGCAYFYNDCGFVPGPPPPPWGGVGNVTVNGNIEADNALTIYLDSTIVHGNVVVNGGGDATMVDHPPAEDGLVLPIKDNIIDGDLTVHDWAGAWFGILRNHVGGDVVVSHIVGTRVGTEAPFVGVPDSTEIGTNTIGGNLVCFGNTPHAQIGDAALEGAVANTVSGHKIGECAGL